MKHNVKNATVIVSAVFGISTTIGQVWVIDNKYNYVKVIILGANFIAWCYFFLTLIKDRPPLPNENTISEMGKKIKSQELTFRHIRTEPELEQIWLIDNKIYGDFNISKQALYDWYSKYKMGAFVVYSGPQFLGYVGIYPLYNESFQKLRKGELTEERLSSHDLCNYEEAQFCSTWYFSGFALDEPSLFEQMMSSTFSEWSKGFEENKVIEAISFAYPGPDSNFLKEIGFYEIKSGEGKNDLPIVYRSFEKKEILFMAQKWASNNEDLVTDLSNVVA